MEWSGVDIQDIHRNLIAEGHKNTNVPQILKVCDVIFRMLATAISWGFWRGPRLFDPLKKHLTMADNVFAQIKK
jgi:hypothetical protein